MPCTSTVPSVELSTTSSSTSAASAILVLVFCVFEHGGSLRSGVWAFVATERLNRTEGSLGEAHPRWFQSMDRIG